MSRSQRNTLILAALILVSAAWIETATTSADANGVTAPLAPVSALPLSGSAPLAADPFAPAVIAISDTVAAPGIEPLGINMTTRPAAPTCSPTT